MNKEIFLDKESTLSALYTQVVGKAPTNFHRYEDGFKDVITDCHIVRMWSTTSKHFKEHQILICAANTDVVDTYIIFSIGASDCTNVDSEGNVHHMEICAHVHCAPDELDEMMLTVSGIVCKAITLPMLVSKHYPTGTVLSVPTGPEPKSKIRYFGLVRGGGFVNEATIDEDDFFLLMAFFINHDEIIDVMQGVDMSVTDQTLVRINSKRLKALWDALSSQDNLSAFIEYNRLSVDLSGIPTGG